MDAAEGGGAITTTIAVGFAQRGKSQHTAGRRVATRRRPSDSPTTAVAEVARGKVTAAPVSRAGLPEPRVDDGRTSRITVLTTAPSNRPLQRTKPGGNLLGTKRLNAAHGAGCMIDAAVPGFAAERHSVRRTADGCSSRYRGDHLAMARSRCGGGPRCIDHCVGASWC